MSITQIIYGSYAFPEKLRPDSDIDILCTKKDAENYKNKKEIVKDKYIIKEFFEGRDAEIVACEYDSYKELLALAELEKWDTKEIYGNIYYLIPYEIYGILKRSHLNYFVHQKKTLHQYYAFCSHYNITDFSEWLPPQYNKVYKHLCDEAAQRFAESQKKINFNQTNEDFFKPSQFLRIYDHDSLHYAVAKDGTPKFLKAKSDLNMADLDESIFFNLTKEERFLIIQEEAVVIGIERYMLKNPTDTERSYFNKGLRKVCCELTKGWLQNYMLDNFYAIANAPRWDWQSQFEANKDTIKKIKAD